jgi:hypothetical protein
VIGQTQLISACHSAGFSQHFWGCKMLPKCEKYTYFKREYFITGFQKLPQKSPNLQCVDSDFILVAFFKLVFIII